MIRSRLRRHWTGWRSGWIGQAIKTGLLVLCALSMMGLYELRALCGPMAPVSAAADESVSQLGSNLSAAPPCHASAATRSRSSASPSQESEAAAKTAHGSSCAHFCCRTGDLSAAQSSVSVKVPVFPVASLDWSASLHLQDVAAALILHGASSSGLGGSGLRSAADPGGPPPVAPHLSSTILRI